MDDSFGDYPLWVAEYGVNSPTVPKGWDNWIIWQHGQSGSVAGVEGSVDLNVFKGGLERLGHYQK
jgi:lysozyme